MTVDESDLNDLTEQIIGCAYRVANTLGSGFLEKVYENAMRVELAKNGLRVQQQHPITILYEGAVVGEYFADLLVNDLVILELKVQDSLGDVALAQCLNYLKATGKPICLLMNFARNKIEIKRIRGCNNEDRKDVR